MYENWKHKYESQNKYRLYPVIHKAGSRTNIRSSDYLVLLHSPRLGIASAQPQGWVFRSLKEIKFETFCSGNTCWTVSFLYLIVSSDFNMGIFIESCNLHSIFRAHIKLCHGQVLAQTIPKLVNWALLSWCLCYMVSSCRCKFICTCDGPVCPFMRRVCSCSQPRRTCHFFFN